MMWLILGRAILGMFFILSTVSGNISDAADFRKITFRSREYLGVESLKTQPTSLLKPSSLPGISWGYQFQLLTVSPLQPKQLAEVHDRSTRRERHLAEKDSYRLAMGGATIGKGAYHVEITIGTPPRGFKVMVDSGSDLLWVPCDCVKCAPPGTNRGRRNLSLPFSTSASSTSQPEPCDGPFCTALTPHSVFGCNTTSLRADSHCQYSYQYGDRDSTEGDLFSDVVHLVGEKGRSDATAVHLGCGRQQSGTLVDGSFGLDGVLGLGRGPLSLLSQLAAQGWMEEAFSLCMEGSSRGGTLVLGSSASTAGMRSTPLLTPGHDLVEVKGIAVGSYQLDLPAGTFSMRGEQGVQGGGGVLVDSGTTFTMLPLEVYRGIMEKALDASGLARYTVPGRPLFDCVVAPPPGADLTGPQFPMLIITLEGGAQWEIPPFNYLFIVGTDSTLGEVLCVAAAVMPAVESGPSCILGETWLRNFLLHFDHANNRLSWRPLNCTTGAPWDMHPASSKSDNSAGVEVQVEVSANLSSVVANLPILEGELSLMLASDHTELAILSTGQAGGVGLEGAGTVITARVSARPASGNPVSIHSTQPLAAEDLSILQLSLSTLVQRPKRLFISKSLFGETLSFTVKQFPGGFRAARKDIQGKFWAMMSFVLERPLAQLTSKKEQMEDLVAATLGLRPFEEVMLLLKRVLPGPGAESPWTGQSAVSVHVAPLGGGSLTKARRQQLAAACSFTSASDPSLGLSEAGVGNAYSVRIAGTG